MVVAHTSGYMSGFGDGWRSTSVGSHGGGAYGNGEGGPGGGLAAGWYGRGGGGGAYGWGIAHKGDPVLISPAKIHRRLVSTPNES